MAHGAQESPTSAPIFFFFSCLRATPLAHSGSQAKGQIGAAAAGLHHSHSNTGSKQRLQPTQELMALILNPLREARDQTLILMDTSRVRYC